MFKYLLIVATLLIVTACTQQPTPADDLEAMDQPNKADTTVTVYQEGDNTIEEKRVKGFLYSVKVTPKHGKPYYLINADGDNSTLQNSGPKQKIPSWTIFSW